MTFNIYKVGGPNPINGEPVAAQTYERAGEFGTEECLLCGRSRKIGNRSVESDLSEPVVRDAPRHVRPESTAGVLVVAGPGAISLSWDANTEPDLAGYLVLRGEAAGDTLQPLTPTPIAATNYEDKTAQPGVRYVYAIVAVDKATPPNRSEPSARLEETAR